MTLKELREKRAEHWEKMKNFLDKNRGENGLLSAESDEAYSRMEKELDAYDKEVSRLENAEKIDKAMSEPTSTPIATNPKDSATSEKKAAADDYAKAFFDGLRTKFRVVSDTLQEKVEADGGYLVPEKLDSDIVVALEQENFVRRVATIMRTSMDLKIPVESSFPEAQWTEETGAITFSDPQFAQVALSAYKLTAGIKVSEELLSDSVVNLQAFLSRRFARQFAAAEEKAFLVGTGTNQPTGIFDATGGGTDAGSADLKTLKGDALIDLYYKLERPYRARACYIINDENIAAIRKMKDNNGAYLWQPSLVAGEPDKLFGLPLYTSKDVPTDKIAVGDMSYYYIGDRGARTFKVLPEVFAVNDLVGFVMKERVDGKLILKQAVQILTLSSGD